MMVGSAAISVMPCEHLKQDQWASSKCPKQEQFCFIFNFYWSIDALQRCVSFYCIAKWISSISSEWVNEVAQSCPALCYPMDCNLSGSSVHGIFQAKILEWVAISFSRRFSPTQELNPGLSHDRQTLYRLSHQGSESINWSVVSDSLWPHGLYSPPIQLYSP